MRSAELSGAVKRGGPIALEQSVSYTVDCGHVSLARLDHFQAGSMCATHYDIREEVTLTARRSYEGTQRTHTGVRLQTVDNADHATHLQDIRRLAILGNDDHARVVTALALRRSKVRRSDRL